MRTRKADRPPPNTLHSSDGLKKPMLGFDPKNWHRIFTALRKGPTWPAFHLSKLAQKKFITNIPLPI